MRGRLCALALACAFLAGCSPLPRAREMGDMALLRTMGVDWLETGLSVTASTGPRARGLQAEGQSALVLSAQSQSLSGACLAMQGQSDSYVFFGYVDQLLLGEELARHGVVSVLDYFARDVELGLGAQLWLVREASAEEAVRSGGDQGVEARLSTLQIDSEMGVATISRTAGEVYADLLEQGAAYVPALIPAEGGEGDASLLEGGYGILKGELLAGYLEGREARGLELLAGRPGVNLLEGELPENRAALRVTQAHTEMSPIWEGNKLIGLTLTCRVEADLLEYRYPLSDQERKELTGRLASQVENQIRGALDKLRQWQADCLGLGAQVALTSPGKWQAIQEDWPSIFAALEPDLQIRVSIQE